MQMILVDKSRHQLTLMNDSKMIAAFPVLIGAIAGPKERTMDRRTPEGQYHVCQLLPDEAAAGKGFYKGLHVSYPAPHDIRRGLSQNVIDQETHDRLLHEYTFRSVPKEQTDLGCNIAIHAGLLPDEKFERGTLGCIVLRNADMDIVYDFSYVGLPIIITP